jgi:hypothetical protein
MDGEGIVGEAGENENTYFITVEGKGWREEGGEVGVVISCVYLCFSL